MRKVFKILKVKLIMQNMVELHFGVKAPVIVAHGKSNPKAIQNAIFQAINAASSNLDNIIEQKISKI